MPVEPSLPIPVSSTASVRAPKTCAAEENIRSIEGTCSESAKSASRRTRAGSPSPARMKRRCRPAARRRRGRAPDARREPPRRLLSLQAAVEQLGPLRGVTRRDVLADHDRDREASRQLREDPLDRRRPAERRADHHDLERAHPDRHPGRAEHGVGSAHRRIVPDLRRRRTSAAPLLLDHLLDLHEPRAVAALGLVELHADVAHRALELRDQHVLERVDAPPRASRSRRPAARSPSRARRARSSAGATRARPLERAVEHAPAWSRSE